MHRFGYLLLLILISNSSAFGQHSLLGNHADKWLTKGLFSEIHHQPKKAIKYYKKSIGKAPKALIGYELLASLYDKQQSFDKAAKILKEAKERTSGFGINQYYHLANSLFKAKKYHEAAQIVNRMRHDIKISDSTHRKIYLLAKNIRWARNAYKNPDTVLPKNLGKAINSPYNDNFPTISQDDRTLLFIRKTNGVDRDFYRSHRGDSTQGWLPAKALASPPNSPQQELSPMLSQDGHYMFFTRCQITSPNGWALGNCDLYFSYTENGGWSQPIPFGATINTPDFEGMPCLSPDRNTLYFVSDRPGGYGGKDIWKSEFKNGLWQIPVNLGPKVNTAGDETSPWISIDNKTLYFTSNGFPGFGGNDLYMTRKTSDTTWRQPINLGYPINTPSQDVSMTVGINGKTAYFASNRKGGEGGMDIYRVTLPKKYRPEPHVFVYGIVRDSLTHKRLPNAFLTWRDTKSGRLMAKFPSNRGDASYIHALPLNQQLALKVHRHFYKDFMDTLSFTKIDSFPIDTINIALLPSDYIPPLKDTTLLTVYFSTGSHHLTDSIKQLIKENVRPFKYGKYNEFYINGYTDIIGSPLVNKNVSKERAAAVYNVLLSVGISPVKIFQQGWGAQNPLATNETKEGRARNRRAVLSLKTPK